MPSLVLPGKTFPSPSSCLCGTVQSVLSPLQPRSVYSLVGQPLHWISTPWAQNWLHLSLKVPFQGSRSCALTSCHTALSPCPSFLSALLSLGFLLEGQAASALLAPVLPEPGTQQALST